MQFGLYPEGYGFAGISKENGEVSRHSAVDVAVCVCVLWPNELRTYPASKNETSFIHHHLAIEVISKAHIMAKDSRSCYIPGTNEHVAVREDLYNDKLRLPFKSRKMSCLAMADDRYKTFIREANSTGTSSISLAGRGFLLLKRVHLSSSVQSMY